MTLTSRALVATAAVLALPLLAGCGGSDEVSPHTNACRGFLLQSGSGSQALATDARDYGDGDTGMSDSVLADARVIRVAAVAAGLTKNLGNADFETYRKLVALVDTLGVKVNAQNVEGAPTDSQVAVPLQTAVKAAVGRCS